MIGSKDKMGVRAFYAIIIKGHNAFHTGKALCSTFPESDYYNVKFLKDSNANPSILLIKSNLFLSFYIG